MKKLALILALVLATSLFLAACGGGSAPATPPPPPAANNQPADTTPADPGTPALPTANIEGDLVLAWWGNPTRNEQTEGVVDLFEAEFPGVSVELQTYGWGDYWPWLGTMAAGRDLPDVIQQDWVCQQQSAC
jgi:ABC-type glycerol-3-phosphate transport system substrate-binding protein